MQSGRREGLIIAGLVLAILGSAGLLFDGDLDLGGRYVVLQAVSDTLAGLRLKSSERMIRP